MACVLALDTSTAACSVALTINNTIVEDFRVIPRIHNLKILAIIDSLLAEHKVKLNQLDAIAYNYGPGSFTGLRIAAAISQGLALAHQLPIIGISSLQALAVQAKTQFSCDKCISILPARANFAYCSYYSLGKDTRLPVPEGKEQMIAIDKLAVPQQWQDYAVIGNLSTKLQEHLTLRTNNLELTTYPHAKDIALLALDKFKADNTSYQMIPNYINNQVTY